MCNKYQDECKSSAFGNAQCAVGKEVALGRTCTVEVLRRKQACCCSWMIMASSSNEHSHSDGGIRLMGGHPSGKPMGSGHCWEASQATPTSENCKDLYLQERWARHTRSASWAMGSWAST
jgi:hypothetical protein